MHQLLTKDDKGNFHFNGTFRNAAVIREKLLKV